MSDCIVITNSYYYYSYRKSNAIAKYGAGYHKGAQFIMLCGNNRCVNPEHLILLDTVFEEIGKKPCSSCGVWKSKDEFYASVGCANGYLSECKDCYYPTNNRQGNKSAIDVFNAHVIKREGCWGWDFLHKSYPYPKFYCCGVGYIASRFSYETFIGPIPEGMLVCHKCDNPECTNPEHLFVGTHKDNTDDMVSKGRHLYGEKGTKTKLNEDIVRDVRANCVPFDLECGYNSFARKYDVDASTIRDIYVRRTWKHVL